MFFWTSTAAQVALRMETMRKAEAGLVALARRFGDRNTKDDVGQSTYKMELFDTAISSSILPLWSNGADNSCCDDDKEEPLSMHAIRVTHENNQQSSSSNSSQRLQRQEEYPLVIVHGYMNGALYFYRNLAGLANYFNTVISVDLLGWGLSSRPSFRLKDDSVESAEAFFVESLEAWRSKNQIDKMTLAGHSMGGYLSVAYCEKYPERVDRLLLLSPVGVPEETSEEQNDFRERVMKSSLPRRLMYGMFVSLWESGYTPASLLRSFPESRGRRLVEQYIERRLPAIADPDERAVLSEYMYTGNILPGSGEYCLGAILKPGAMAKKPLLRRIPNLGVKNVSFFYGMHDWMDVNGGLDVQRLCLENARGTLSNKNQDHESPNVDVYQVKNAGHLLMLENARGFNTAVIMAAGGKPPEGSTEADLPVVLDVRRISQATKRKENTTTSSSSRGTDSIQAAAQ